MWITADDVHAHLLAAEAEEEETLGYAVDDDVERVGGRYRATEQAVGWTLMLSCISPDALGTHHLSRSFAKRMQ